MGWVGLPQILYSMLLMEDAVKFGSLLADGYPQVLVFEGMVHRKMSDRRRYRICKTYPSTGNGFSAKGGKEN
jgi:hypothetical protein